MTLAERVMRAEPQGGRLAGACYVRALEAVDSLATSEPGTGKDAGTMLRRFQHLTSSLTSRRDTTRRGRGCRSPPLSAAAAATPRNACGGTANGGAREGDRRRRGTADNGDRRSFLRDCPGCCRWQLGQSQAESSDACRRRQAAFVPSDVLGATRHVPAPCAIQLPAGPLFYSTAFLLVFDVRASWAESEKQNCPHRLRRFKSLFRAGGELLCF